MSFSSCIILDKSFASCIARSASILVKIEVTVDASLVKTSRSSFLTTAICRVFSVKLRCASWHSGDGFGLLFLHRSTSCSIKPTEAMFSVMICTPPSIISAFRIPALTKLG